jgi:DNA-binding NarL/FixJ family response regulator
MSNQLDRIEWKLDQIMASLMGATSQPKTDAGEHINSLNRDGFHPPNAEVGETLRLFTTKQQVALQMLLRGADNQEIADRMEVTINTAKVHVRGIAKKLGVSTRSQIIWKVHKEMIDIDENGYMMLSGGLPKDWDENYSEPDPFYGLYRSKNNEPKT